MTSLGDMKGVLLKPTLIQPEVLPHMVIVMVPLIGLILHHILKFFVELVYCGTAVEREPFVEAKNMPVLFTVTLLAEPMMLTRPLPALTCLA